MTENEFLYDRQLRLADRLWDNLVKSHLAKQDPQKRYSEDAKVVIQTAARMFDPEIILTGNSEEEKFSIFITPIIQRYFFHLRIFRASHVNFKVLPFYTLKDFATRRITHFRYIDFDLGKIIRAEILLRRYDNCCKKQKLKTPLLDDWRFKMELNPYWHSNYSAMLPRLSQNDYDFFIHQAIRNCLSEKTQTQLGEVFSDDGEPFRWLLGKSQRYIFPKGLTVNYTDENNITLKGCIETIYPSQQGEPIYFLRNHHNKRLVLISEHCLK